MSLSSNNFSAEQPPKSSNTFADDMPPAATGSFTKDKPPKSDNLASGENTSGGDYGVDFATYGDIYGQGRYGGFVHFRNRTTPPTITHT